MQFRRETLAQLKIDTVLLAVLALFVIGTVAYLASGVLLPFVLAVFVVLIFKPIMLALERRRVPRVVSLAVVFAMVATLLSGISYVLYVSGETVVAELPKYEARMLELSHELNRHAAVLSRGMGTPGKPLNLIDVVQLSTITDWATTGVTEVLEFLTGLFLLLLFSFFMLAGSGDLSAKVRAGFSTYNAERISRVIENIDRQVRQYLVTKTVISLVTGASAWAILSFLGVDFPLFWGLLTFLLNYIPNFGSIIATLLPVSLAVVQFGSLGTPAAVLLLLAGTQVTMGNVVEPKVMQRSLNLSPVLILLALIFWGWLWGVLGMILAVPITSTVKIICENIDSLRPIAVLMSGRADVDGASGAVAAADRPER